MSQWERMKIQTPEMELRAELRAKSTIELHHLITATDTPESTRNMAQEVLWERGKK